MSLRPYASLRALFSGLAISATCLLGACANYVPNLVQPYRPDIQQGNVVTEATLAQLKPGMSADQVKFILGSPLLVDPFHADRWDYVYRLQRGNGVLENSRITLLFKDGVYTGHSGSALPDNKR